LHTRIRGFFAKIRQAESRTIFLKKRKAPRAYGSRRVGLFLEKMAPRRHRDTEFLKKKSTESQPSTLHPKTFYRKNTELNCMKSIVTLALLVLSNIFMTVAWYGHLKFKNLHFFDKMGLFGVILFSWLVAFFEYCLMVPANRIGYRDNGGPFTLLQLKVAQEVITLVVFTVFTLLFFKNEPLKWNHFVGFGFLVLAVYFIRK
jgi:uncharacterized protein